MNNELNKKIERLSGGQREEDCNVSTQCPPASLILEDALKNSKKACEQLQST